MRDFWAPALKGTTVLLFVGVVGFWLFGFAPLLLAKSGEPWPLVAASAGLMPGILLALGAAGYAVGRLLPRDW